MTKRDKKSVQKTIKFIWLSHHSHAQQMGFVTIEFKLNVLENTPNYLIYRDILRHQRYQKQGTVSTKTRSDVRGGGKKPWQQKGSGRARAGSNRSPLWRGGGVVFGPKPKTTTFKLNKKERNLALQTILYNNRKNITIVDEYEEILDEPKTYLFSDICKFYGIDMNQKILFVVQEKTSNLKLMTRNLKNVELISASNLNSLSVLKAKYILITMYAIDHIQEIHCNDE